MSAYDLLIQKLDAFIRKYYKNQLIKGGIYAVGLGLSLFLTVTASEYFGRFSTSIRAFLFFGFSAGILFILFRFVLLPLSKLFGLGRVISHEEAAQIVGTHFFEVRDKLLNTLQLRRMAESAEHADMLEAAIEQKTMELRPVSFPSAVNLSENKKYLKWTFIPISVLIVILIAFPGVIEDGTKRVINYEKEFKPEAPFHFQLISSGFSVPENRDFPISVSLSGDVLPQNVFIEYDGARFRMSAEGKNRFSHTVKKVNKSFTFSFWADGFYSESWTVNVVPAAALGSLKINLNYPGYLNKPDETITGSGDLTVPEGTKLEWFFGTRNSDLLYLILKDSVLRFSPVENQVRHSIRTKSNLPYSVTVKNRYGNRSDTNSYLISVIPDEYPSIAVQETADSLYRTVYYFKGDVSDDHGFRGLSFHYRKQKPGEDERGAVFISVPVSLSAFPSRQVFFHRFNFAELNPEPGDEIVYFFTVYDNDGVNGAKAARTGKKIFRVPGEDELNVESEKAAESIKADLSESLRKAEKIRKESGELNKSLLQKKSLDWQDRKKMEELLKKQKELEKKIEDLKKENEKRNRDENAFKKEDEERIEKQKEMQKLLDELMNDDLKKHMEELEKLLREQDKNKIQEQLKNMEYSSEDLKKQLERTLELFKQMEFDQKLQEIIEKLNQAAERQKELAKETAQEKPDQGKQEAFKEKQEDVNKQFEEIRKDLEDLQNKNEALENKREELKNTEEQEKEISKDQNDASEQINQGQNKKASQNQKSAGEKMEQLSQELQQMQQEMEENQNEEDLESLRKILNNLVRLSFDQEDLMEILRKSNPNSPKYKELAQKQQKLKVDSKIIEDSLFALSKRIPQLEASINQEIADIKRNIDDAVSNLSDREIPGALIKQQYSMTAINNLALMLSEAIENAQMNTQMKMQGNKACKKPGEGMPSPGEMKKLQEQQKKLSEQMKKLAEQMRQKQGETPKPGENQKPGMEGNNGELSKQLAQMAAEQEMIRKKMQEMAEKLGNSQQRRMAQELINKMEENETDLYNKRLNQQMLIRQKEIEIKLLEAENALREQEMDEQRESREGKPDLPVQAEQYKEYLRQKEKQAEMLRTVPAALKPYYRQKVTEFFNKP
jgi:hypothetical protein